MSYDGSDLDIEGGHLRGEIFVARHIPAEALLVTEGCLRIVEQDDVTAIWSELSMTAQFAMKIFLDKCAASSA